MPLNKPLLDLLTNMLKLLSSTIIFYNYLSRKLVRKRSCTCYLMSKDMSHEIAGLVGEHGTIKEDVQLNQ